MREREYEGGVCVVGRNKEKEREKTVKEVTERENIRGRSVGGGGGAK